MKKGDIGMKGSVIWVLRIRNGFDMGFKGGGEGIL